MPTPLTSSLVAAHERLYPRVVALLKQVDRGRAGAPVSGETAKLARTLCQQAERVLGAEMQAIGIPGGTASRPRALPDQHGLAVTLGQVVAGLEAFEAEHSASIDGVTNWLMADGTSRPVARHKGKTRPAARPQAEAAKSEQPKPVPPSSYDVSPEVMKMTVIKRLLQRENERYMQGYRDAQAGKPPIRPITEVGPVPRGGHYVSHWRGGQPVMHSDDDE